MPKPGERADYLEKKLFPLWLKMRGRERQPPPDDELCELFEFLGLAIAHEYLRCDADPLPAAPPRRLDFYASSIWFINQFSQWRDIYRQHWYIAELVVTPALGGGDLQGPTRPHLPKLRQGARDYAVLRRQYQLWQQDGARLQLEAPYAGFWPYLRTYSSYIIDHLEPLPQNLERHVQLRRTLGYWDETLIQTLLCGVCPDFESFDIEFEKFQYECEDAASAHFASAGLVFKRTLPEKQP